jgi:hypothetical protein
MTLLTVIRREVGTGIAGFSGGGHDYGGLHLTIPAAINIVKIPHPSRLLVLSKPLFGAYLVSLDLRSSRPSYGFFRSALLGLTLFAVASVVDNVAMLAGILTHDENLRNLNSTTVDSIILIQ